MNPLLILGLTVLDTGESLYGWTRERLTHAVRTLYVAVIVPAVLLVIAIICGKIGEMQGLSALISAAEFLTALSGFLASLLLAFFWLKTAVLTHLFAAASRVASGLGEALPFVDELPKVEHDTAEAFLKWMRGITGWLTLFCLYGMLVPIWRSLTWTLVAGTVFLFLSAAMTALWVDGDRMKRIVIGLTVLVLVYATANLIAPVRMAEIRYGIDRGIAQVETAGGNRLAMAEQERKVGIQQAEQERAIVQRFRDRQLELRKRAYQQCGGKFCSQADEAEYRDIDSKIEAIKNGTYWTPEKKVRKATPSSSSPTRQKAVPHRQVRSSGDTGRRTLSSRQAGRVWSELDKYDDL